jgi:hypothetical protein
MADFVDIGGIVDHHCLEGSVVVCFVNIVGTVDHHCLEVIVCLQYQLDKQSPLNSDGQQFHQYQLDKQSPLNSDGQQFQQYQQNKQLPIPLNS